MKVSDILIWAFLILTIVIVSWYIFGESPTLEQAILVLILTLSITSVIKLSVLETKFNFLARDFKRHVKEHKDNEK